LRVGCGRHARRHVTLDLGGHRLTGPGAASPYFPGSIGIALTETATPRVQNGTISGWETGTGLSPDNAGFDPANATFGHLTYADNGTGVLGSNSTFDVANTRFVHNSNAGISGLSTFATVRNSTFARNVRGINLSGGGSIKLKRSVLERNDVGVSCSEVECVITRSSLHYNTTAIAAFFATGKITRNDIRGNHIGFRTDFNPDPGFAHELALNLFTRNGSAVVVNAFGTAYLHDNRFVANGVGFSVPSRDFTFTARLVRNVFTRNGNGIYVSSAGAALKQNTALHNRGWGIHAPGRPTSAATSPGATAATPQCLGVTCASHR
jgi:hypothetical protein